jgi:hypothetical protein
MTPRDVMLDALRQGQEILDDEDPCFVKLKPLVVELMEAIEYYLALEAGKSCACGFCTAMNFLHVS